MSKIVLSKETVELMKVAAAVNQNLLIRENSNLIWSMSVAKNIVLKAEASETFPIEFPVYNTLELLATLTLFKNPELEFKDKLVVITEAGETKGTKVKYCASAKEVLVFPSKQSAEPQYDLTFNMPAETLAQITKASGVLGAPDLSIVCTGSEVSLKLHDKKNPSVGVMELPIDVTSDKVFQADLRVENLKLLSEDYTVKVSFKGIAKFTSKKVELFVALETSSKL